MDILFHIERLVLAPFLNFNVRYNVIPLLGGHESKEKVNDPWR